MFLFKHDTSIVYLNINQNILNYHYLSGIGDELVYIGHHMGYGPIVQAVQREAWHTLTINVKLIFQGRLATCLLR